MGTCAFANKTFTKSPAIQQNDRNIEYVYFMIERIEFVNLEEFKRYSLEKSLKYRQTSFYDDILSFNRYRPY